MRLQLLKTLLSTMMLALSSFLGLTHGQTYDPAPEQLRVMTWNVEWMFDDYQGDNRSSLAREQSAPSKEYWETKLDGVAEVLAAHPAEVVALQEIEGKQTLAAIASRLKTKHELEYRYAFIEGTDSFTEQDVGFLIRSGMVSYRRHEQSNTMFDSKDYYNISKHLVAELHWSNVPRPLTIMTVHLRAKADTEELRIKQAKLAREWLQPQLDAGQDVIILGDLNSEHSAAESVDPSKAQGEIAVLQGTDEQPKMVDLLSRLAEPSQSTHLILDKQFDRIFASQSLLDVGVAGGWHFEKIEILAEAVRRGAPDGMEHWQERLTLPLDELDLSDHFPVLATFRLPATDQPANDQPAAATVVNPPATD